MKCEIRYNAIRFDVWTSGMGIKASCFELAFFYRRFPLKKVAVWCLPIAQPLPPRLRNCQNGIPNPFSFFSPYPQGVDKPFSKLSCHNPLKRPRANSDKLTNKNRIFCHMFSIKIFLVLNVPYLSTMPRKWSAGPQIKKTLACFLH